MPRPFAVVTRLGAVALAVAVAMTLMASPASAVGRDWPSRMLAKVNEVRAAAGAPPVVACASLADSATRYANELSDTGTISHTGPDGSTLLQRMERAGYRPRVGGENLAAGQRTVVQVMRAWRASPGHLANITDPRFTHVGFGYAVRSSESYHWYWVQHFGTGGHC